LAVLGLQPCCKLDLRGLGGIALLADLIHNGAMSDCVSPRIAFMLRSKRAEAMQGWRS